MSKPKLGPWHPASVKPVHVGVYEVETKLYDTPVYSKWDGRNWALVSFTVEIAARCNIVAYGQSKEWRGLAEKPA